MQEERLDPCITTPTTTVSSPVFHLLIEGYGSVIQKYYREALIEIPHALKRDLTVTFADDDPDHKDEPGPDLRTEIPRLRSEMNCERVYYLNKATADDKRLYGSLHPNVVIIATPPPTHINIAEKWLDRPEAAQPEKIFIEKPIDSSLSAVQRLQLRIRHDELRVVAFDHYRTKVSPLAQRTKEMRKFLGGENGGGIRYFSAYLLENHSADDPKYGKEPAVPFQHDGAIESEGRIDVLNSGLVSDLLPHALAILDLFAPIRALQLSWIRPGQYVGVDGDPAKRTTIDRETFAEVRWICEGGDPFGLFPARAVVGKGVRGVRKLGPEFDHDTKVIYIVGINNNYIKLDLRSNGGTKGGVCSEAYLIEESGRIHEIIPLVRKPYIEFIRHVVTREYKTKPDGFALRLSPAYLILQKIEEISRIMPDKSLLGTYEGAVAGHRASILMEDFIRNLTPILVDHPEPD